jgi:hypothetical protein
VTKAASTSGSSANGAFGKNVVLPRLRPERTNISATQTRRSPRRRNDIGVMIHAGGDDLLRLNDFELRQLVANLRGLLEFQAFGGRFHAPAKILADLVVAALEHLDRGATSRA